MKKEADPSFFNVPLIDEIKTIIQEGRQQVAQAINAGLTATYWHIGERIQKDILQNNRAEYGEQVVATLSRHLTKEFGKGWSRCSLTNWSVARIVSILPRLFLTFKLSTHCVDN